MPLQTSEKDPKNIIIDEVWKNVYSRYLSAPFPTKSESLKKSVTLSKVKNFHKKFYRPENLVINIAGKDAFIEEILEELIQIEQKLLQKIAKNPISQFEHPWDKPLKKLDLTEDIYSEIEFPSTQETTGKKRDF